MRMDSYIPVIIIEGFLAFGVVLLLYFLHVREMRQIKAKKAKLEAEQAACDPIILHNSNFQIRQIVLVKDPFVLFGCYDHKFSG